MSANFRFVSAHISAISTPSTRAPTVINHTNDTYFNLAGEASGTIYDETLAIDSSAFQPTDDIQVPAGSGSVLAGQIPVLAGQILNSTTACNFTTAGQAFRNNF